MAKQYNIISADSHLEIDSKRWVNRVPEKFRDRAPRLIHLTNGGDAWLIEGLPLRETPSDLYAGKGRDKWQPFGQSYENTPGTGSPQQRLREQDQDGIDAEVMFPGVSGPGLWRSIRDDDAYKAVVRAYNDYLGEEYCPVAPDRLIGIGVIPRTGVDDAIAEMEHCARMGLKGVLLSAFPNGRGYPAPEDDTFWAAALEMQMPLTVHGQIGRAADAPLVTFPSEPTEAVRRMSRSFGEQLTKYARPPGENAVQLFLSGVFDRFPALRIHFAETQIGWIPFFLHQADQRYERHHYWAERLLDWKPTGQIPSDAIREHCSWGFQCDPIGVENRRHIGVERVFWATDFPHQESEWPHSNIVLDENFVGVPDQEVRRMVVENAIEFFHLEQEQPKQGQPLAAAKNV